MKKRQNLVIFMLLGMLGFGLVASVLYAENVTLTTYYPAPYGSYDRLRLLPRNSLLSEEFCGNVKDLGLMYYDNGEGGKAAGLYICQKLEEKKFAWIFIGRPFKVSKVVTQGKVVCLKSDDSFGVCVNNPSHEGSCACK